MNKLTKYAVDYANAETLGDNAVADMAGEIAGASTREKLAVMLDVAEAYCKLPKYKGTELGDEGDEGRPTLVHPDHPNVNCPAQQTFNRFWKKVDTALGGKMIPGCRASKKASNVDPVPALVKKFLALTAAQQRRFMREVS